MGLENKCYTMAKKLLNKNNVFNSLLNLYITQVRNIQSTVDPADVYRHSQHMKKWWDTDGPMGALHSLNHLRIPFIKNGVLQTSEIENSLCLKGKKILDVGCGGGILSESLARLGAEVTGIDASKELIEIAQSHASQNKCLGNNLPTYICSTIEAHADVNSEQYDAVVASEIIEHVVEKELFVESCVRVTKPDGKLFFTTPSKTRLSQFFIIFFNERILRKIPKGTHQYEKFMTPNELKFILEMNNCLVESTRGFNYRPLANRWDWINHKWFMFAMQAVKSKKKV